VKSSIVLFGILVSAVISFASNTTGHILTKVKSNRVLVSAALIKSQQPPTQIDAIVKTSGQLVRSISFPANTKSALFNQFQADWVKPQSASVSVNAVHSVNIAMGFRVRDSQAQGSGSVYYNYNGPSAQQVREQSKWKALSDMTSFQEQMKAAETQQAFFQQHYDSVAQHNQQYLNQIRQESVHYQKQIENIKDDGLFQMSQGITNALGSDNVLTLQARRARDEAHALSMNPMRTTEVEYNRPAANMMDDQLKNAIKEKDFDKMSELAEALTYGKVDGQHNKSKVLATIARPDGVLKVGGTFDHGQFKTKVYSSEGQIVRRLANRYQSMWAQSGGLKVLTGDEKARYVLGATALTLADRMLADAGNNDLALQRAAGLLELANTIADSISGFVDGVAHSIESIVKAVPELAKLAGNGIYNLLTDPVEAWNITQDFIMSLPEVGGAIMSALVKDYDVLKKGNAYQRGELLGRYALDILSMVGSAGAGVAVKGATTGARVGELGSVIVKTAPLGTVARGAKILENSFELLDKMPKAARDMFKSLKNDEMSTAVGQAYIKAVSSGKIATANYLEKVAANGFKVASPSELKAMAEAHSKVMDKMESIPGVSKTVTVTRAARRDLMINGKLIRDNPELLFEKHKKNFSLDHRYTIGGELGDGGLYVTEGSIALTKDVLAAETKLPLNELFIAEKQFTMNNLLDLGNADVVRSLGIDPSVINRFDDYTWTQMIGDAAKRKDFGGIIFPSTKNPAINNIVIFY
jgi:hypothetical protein